MSEWRGLFTIAHSEPAVIARTVAARGMLYISASSPKLPVPMYLPTSFSVPSSLATTIEKVPLCQGNDVEGLKTGAKIG